MDQQLAHLASFLAQGWVRGIVSGFGLLNIWIAFSVLFHRKRSLLNLSMPDQPPDPLDICTARLRKSRLPEQSRWPHHPHHGRILRAARPLPPRAHPGYRRLLRLGPLPRARRCQSRAGAAGASLGSERAPPAEQPAKGAELDACRLDDGSANELNAAAPKPPWRWRATTKTRAGSPTCLPNGR